jgi:hypothetical protein
MTNLMHSFLKYLYIKKECIKLVIIQNCKKPYSIGEELIKPSLIVACNEVLGQSAASK